MKKNWILLLLATVLSLVGITLQGGVVSYLFFAFCVGIFLICGAYLLYVYFSFRIYQTIGKKTVVKGEMVPYQFVLANEFPVVFTNVSVSFYEDYSETREIPEYAGKTLFPGEEARFETALVCKYRGEYSVGIRRVTVVDFLHLFSLEYQSPSEMKVQVLPRVIELSDVRPWRSFLMEQESLFAAEKSEPDIPVRKYEPGDPMTKVHWKATARTGRLMSRTMTGLKKQEIAIFLDNSKVDYENEWEKIATEDTMLEAAIGLLRFFLKEGIQPVVGFDGSECFMEKALHMGQFDVFYQALSRVHFDGGASFGASLVKMNRQECNYQIWITARETEELARYALEQAEQDVRILVLYVAEKSGEYWNTISNDRIQVVNMKPGQEVEEALS